MKIPHAFTLIELLVVVTMIVVLLTLPTPALDKAMSAAESVRCLTNLRAVHSASMWYAQDYRSVLPPAQVLADNTSTTYAAYPVGLGGTIWWHFLVQDPKPPFTAKPYLDYKSNSGRAFFCPTNKNTNNGLNTFNYAWNWELTWGGETRKWRRLKSLRRPSALLLVFDQNRNGNATGGAYHAYFSGNYMSSGTAGVSNFIDLYKPSWHDGKGSYAFADGRLESVLPADVEDEKGQGWFFDGP
jgi:prepilin-type N-terminal cleavage/methylation domain-containing protein/prepilin-type processing-associated H-X9-DG protein